MGLRGVRIQSIVNELQGEKIDILEWSKDPNRYIQNALSPSQVHRVLISSDNENATAIVPDRHLSLAIGKEGQNARLAAKLTGWKVDIKSDLEVDITKEPEPVAPSQIEDESLSDSELIEKLTASIESAQPRIITEQIETEPVVAESDDQKVAVQSETEEEEILAAMIAEEEAAKSENTSDTTEETEVEGALTAEEELLLLEEETVVDETEEEEFGADLSEVPEDIWSIHRAGAGQQTVGAIRFAEDIEDLRGGITARKGRKTSNQSSANRSNRRNRPARRRR